MFRSSGTMALTGTAFWAFALVCGAAEFVFPDPALEVIVRKAIERPTGAIQADDLAGLKKLTIYTTEVRDLTGLEHCVNLVDLNAQANKIENIDVLAKMPQLERLFLNINRITDISALAGLKNLDHLSLTGNPIKSLAPIANLSSLRHLGITGMDVSDLGVLSSLTSLEDLYVSHMSLRDLEFVRGLTRLRRLSASHNQIQSLEPLRNLRGLAFIELDDNRIGDISPLSKMGQIRRLDLSNNEITSVEGFPPLMPDAVVRLYWNQISDIQPLVRSARESRGITFELGENPLTTESLCRDFVALAADNNRAVYRYDTSEDEIQLFPGVDLLCGSTDSPGEDPDANSERSEPVVAASAPTPPPAPAAAAVALPDHGAAEPGPDSEPVPMSPTTRQSVQSPNTRGAESAAEVAVTLADTQFHVSVASYGLDLRNFLGVIVVLGVGVLLVVAWRIPHKP